MTSDEHEPHASPRAAAGVLCLCGLGAGFWHLFGLLVFSCCLLDLLAPAILAWAWCCTWCMGVCVGIWCVLLHTLRC
jgi:hypothetical protein